MPCAPWLRSTRRSVPSKEPPKAGPPATRTLEKLGRAVASQKQVVFKAQEGLQRLHAAIGQATTSLQVAQDRLDSLRED